MYLDISSKRVAGLLSFCQFFSTILCIELI